MSELAHAEAALEALCKDRTESYRQLIRGEQTASQLTYMGPTLPGQLRLLELVRSRLFGNPHYTYEQADGLYQTMVQRQRLVDARRAAGAV